MAKHLPAQTADGAEDLLPPGPRLRLDAFETVHDALPAAAACSEACVASADDGSAGAADSACTRTVAGSGWFERCMALSHDFGLDRFVTSTPERESFRVGNNGTLVSERRVRVPAVLLGHSGYISISIVPSKSLGLLLGKDFP